VQRYFIELGFKGTNYHGWQFQPNAISVQQVIEETMQRLLHFKISLTGAGRTDTGVHATCFVAHFDCIQQLPWSEMEIVRRLNYMLPEDIVMYNIFPVDANSHSRFDALSRTYKYYINRYKDPFIKDTTCFISRKMDIDAMKMATGELFNFKDFGSFCRTNNDVRTNICTIMQAEWDEADNLLVFTIKANRFLRNMVRAIVGTILQVGYGNISVKEFKKIIEAKDRRKAAASAPAQGLFLTGIEYPSMVFSRKNNNNPII
jgi:tRNA pseudouridine38-40 synthase